MARGSYQVPSGGWVRTPDRPVGWVAPGPAPTPERQWAPHLLPRENEDLCFLTGDWRILQRLDGHRYSLDDLVTAWFAARLVVDRPVRRTLDLGCGIGSVLMMTAWRFSDARCVGVERQAVSVDLARRSLQINGATPRCAVVHQDLRDTNVQAHGPFDLITGTPPYILPGDGVISAQIQRGPCRHTLFGGVEDYCATAARHLPIGGRFAVCQAASDLDRVRNGADAAGLTIFRQLDVIPRAGRAALFSVFAMARADDCGRPAFQAVERLTVRDRQGRRTDACLAMRAEMGFPPSA